MPLFSQARYATVASTAALVVALGGTSYAAVAISGADIKDGTVTTADVKNHNLELKDFAGSTRAGLTGATGAAGTPGAPGAKGDQGIQGIQGLTGPSDAYSDRDTTSTDLTTGVDLVQLSLDLGPGSYLVLAKALVNHDSGTGSRVFCYVSYSGGPGDDSSVSLPDAVGSTAMLNDQLAISLTDPSTTVEFRCNQSGGGNSLTYKTLSAIKVGTLH
jgi:hypothetical protein